MKMSLFAILNLYLFFALLFPIVTNFTLHIRYKHPLINNFSNYCIIAFIAFSNIVNTEINNVETHILFAVGITASIMHYCNYPTDNAQ